ncbi:MAG: L-serine ammonia-lyase, iron-sulfur-dependent, subunit alpha [Treponema sp.]|jgi:L-cysteine desulfidase|nr:L-serine ammonia-lyase, iron-sulfur-dependent, subunit alpha [Treponema sp.]
MMNSITEKQMEEIAADEKSFLSLFQEELVTAMGCTEPAAVALAGAAARECLGAVPDMILIRASRDIIKNTMNVGIPNTPLKGITAAAALGIVIGNPADGLNILSGLSEKQEFAAVQLTRSGTIKLELVKDVPPVFIEIRIGKGNKNITALIVDKHDRVEIFDTNKEIVSYQTKPAERAGLMTPEKIFSFVNTVRLEKIEFLIDAAEVNLNLAEHSASVGYGIKVGKTMLNGDHNEKDLFHLGASLAAAASDARMAGCSKPVIINSGSGNQGITVSVPVLVLARGLGKSRDETARALCLSQLIALMLTERKDRLSALCGVFTAAVGTGAGFVRIMGGNDQAVILCIKNMIGNLMGMICDGAKGSCALKIYTCVKAAELSARLAMAGNSIPDSEGILADRLEDTLNIVEKISHQGMVPLDETILEVMIEKGNGLV